MIYTYMNIRTDMHIHPYPHPHLHVYMFTCNYVEQGVIIFILTETHPTTL